MRLQVRTTKLQQRSADRLPGTWQLCVYSWRRCFFSLNQPQQVDKSSRQEDGHKEHIHHAARGSGHSAERGLIRQSNFTVACFSFPGLLAPWAACGVRLSAPLLQIKSEWKSWWKRTRVGFRSTPKSGGGRRKRSVDWKPNGRCRLGYSCRSTLQFFVVVFLPLGMLNSRSSDEGFWEMLFFKMILEYFQKNCTLLHERSSNAQHPKG